MPKSRPAQAPDEAPDEASDKAGRKAARPPGPCPTRASLHAVALRHLARFASTQAGLLRVLDRRILRWQHASQADNDVVAPARAAAREVAQALVDSGAIDDAGFAEARARRLVRAGRSRRAVSAHLSAKGIAIDTAAAALPDPEAEFMAAIALARRRRLGPFHPPGAEPGDPGRTLAIFARAGFPRDIAERALRLEPDEAVDRLATFKRA